ncbi:acyl-CoA synthetase [Nocardia sputorum]|uniref:class I adenylate-forming enzyme family protein n=1 Tax=Nocardia sputorum TaxID=2984338 RepID=UPI002493AD78|nr:AMP-binding protein [Nocardia sputorum]BDT92416.1 acyl-CoA synthetase [Nocardia sputorum]
MDAVNQPFLVSSGSTPYLTFGQLDAWTDTLVGRLAERGVGPGEVVVADLPNSPAFVAVLRATWRVGAVFAPLNPQLSAREKEVILNLSRPRVVVSATLPPVDVTTVLWRDPFDSPADIDLISAAPMPESPVEEQDRLILFTSGSTGQPKAVALTEANVALGIAAVADHFALTSGDRTIAMLPWSHGHGLFATLLATESVGCPVVLPTRAEAIQPHTLLASTRPTWLTMVPPQLALLTSGLEATGIRPRDMRFLRTASAPLPLPLADRAEQLLGCPVAEALGLTETSHQAAANPPTWDRVLGTVGRPTGMEFRLVGEEVVGGKELHVRGAALFSRYLGNPEATTEAFTVDGWFRTRDVARWEQGEHLRLLGRLSEIVNRGGYKVSPIEVEAVLEEHPDVMASLATGVPHPYLGHEVAAVVRLRDGSRATTRDILKHCRAHLADYKVPGQIRMVEALPQLPNGKPSRRMAARLFGAEQ